MPNVSSAMPTLRGAPLVGNLMKFRRSRLELLEEAAATGAEVVRTTFGPREIVLCTSSEAAEELLVTSADDFQKTELFKKFTGALLGNGLLLSEGDFHRRQRRLMAPAFQHRRIAGYAGVMAEFAERRQARWKDGERVDLSAEMMALTLDIVGKTLFDTNLDGEESEIGAALTVAMRYFNENVTRVLPIEPSWPTPGNLRNRRAVARLDETVLRIVRERRASGEDKGDVLSMLLAAQDQDDGTSMTDQQVRDEAMTLFLAGHETTANALTWTFSLLARNPAVAEALRAEATGVLGGRTPAFEDLPRLPFALQTFKEGLRLYPPAYMVTRVAVRDTTLRGHPVRAGTIVMAGIWAIQRRPDYFPNPLAFDPTRFTPEREKALPRFAFMPFGGGARICIGNHFALMEGQLILATLAQRVRFEPVAPRPPEPEPLITLRPKGGLPATVRRLAAA